MGRVYRTAKGKTLDMGMLAAQHEKTRAVSNLAVNARGDTIDSHGKITEPVTEKISNAYQSTVTSKSAVVRPGVSPSANPNAPLSPKQLREIEALDAKDAKDAKEKEVANTNTETPLLNELIKESATYVSPIEADIAPIPPVEPQIVESIANPVPSVEDPTVNTNNTQLKPASEAPNSFDSDGNPVLTKEELELEEELQDDIDIEAIKKACLDAETKQKKGKK